LGCDTIQIYTKAHREGIEVFKKLNDDLKNLLNKMNETVETIKGTFNYGK